jgi:hypothetical protein
MGNQMSLLDYLDYVLKWLNLEHNHARTFAQHEIVFGLESEFGFKKDSINHAIIGNLLKKLIDDKYVELCDVFKTYHGGESGMTKEYQITFKGRVWLEQNGYRGEYDQNNQAEQRVRVSQNLQYILAVGVITPFLWSLMELIKNYFPSWLPISEVSLIFLLGACLGAILWHILPPISKEDTR